MEPALFKDRRVYMHRTLSNLLHLKPSNDTSLNISLQVSHVCWGGLCKVNKNSQKNEITMDVGGWVGPGVTRNFCCRWKIISKYWYTSTYIVWTYTMWILCVNRIIKVVSHYDLSVLSTSVMGFQNKVWIWVCVGGVRSIQSWDVLNFFLTFAKPLNSSWLYNSEQLDKLDHTSLASASIIYVVKGNYSSCPNVPLGSQGVMFWCEIRKISTGDVL